MNMFVWSAFLLLLYIQGWKVLNFVQLEHITRHYPAVNQKGAVKV